MGKRLGAFEKRIHEVDLIRGILILIVILDHLLWFIKANTVRWFGGSNWLYQATNFYWTSEAREVIRQIVLFFFVFISGVSCAFSRNNWKRAAKMILVWGALSVITNLVDGPLNGGKGTWIIDFNVIGVLAWSVLIYCFFQNWSWKGLVSVMLICYLITISLTLVPVATRNATYIPSLWAPDSLVKPAVENPVRNCGDWMPLFPYICFFFGGAIITRFIYKDKKPLFERKEWERPLCFIGRNTIWVYLLHEPILIGVFFLIGLMVGA